jgi:hypothetical protein
LFESVLRAHSARHALPRVRTHVETNAAPVTSILGAFHHFQGG